ncbi:hypothetical protein XENTR_v10001826 [Xenopus tropicalis]|nr:hypothetical protein XENTR_v10001826 [Xenopus tropicalis]
MYIEKHNFLIGSQIGTLFNMAGPAAVLHLRWTCPLVPTELISVLFHTLAQFSRNRSRALEQSATFPEYTEVPTKGHSTA